MKQHWKLTLSYDGSLFHGWQVQPGLPTVQGTLAKVIRHIVGEDVLPQGSGRTDAGVHALAQVASFGLETTIPAANLLRALNRVLPSSIRVMMAEQVSSDFHARMSAQAKTYEYRVFLRRPLPVEDGSCQREEICPPFVAPFVWDCRWPLNVPAMQAAAALVCGTHDFTSFAASDPERNVRRSEDKDGKPLNPVKTIWQSTWVREGDLLLYRVRGSGFLHHMVRNLVGTFVDIGRGVTKPEDVTRILAARSRSSAGATAPARGLFLRSVEYERETPHSDVVHP